MQIESAVFHTTRASGRSGRAPDESFGLSLLPNSELRITGKDLPAEWLVFQRALPPGQATKGSNTELNMPRMHRRAQNQLNVSHRSIT